MFSSPERQRGQGMAAWAGLARHACLVLALAVCADAMAALPGIGRAATPKEIEAWDIDVRPDFKGLPKGSGSVAQGQDVWESKCASCHGIFGESNEVFSPLVGGTTAQDVKTGRVARLTDPGFPGRTTLMKVPTVSTLWDYIRRAMPWNQPKSLTVDEVYAVTAFLLNLGGIVPDDFVLSQDTMKDAQARMPNRNGMSTQHGLWPGKGMGHGRPDVKAQACMSQCNTDQALNSVASILPEYARNAHGNLADQNRLVGAQHGADTAAPAGAPQSRLPRPPGRAQSQDTGAAPDVSGLLAKHSCTACHATERKIVGPAFKDVTERYASRNDALAVLAARIKSGGVGNWGQIPMPAQNLSDADAQSLARWLLNGARKQ